MYPYYTSLEFFFLTKEKVKSGQKRVCDLKATFEFRIYGSSSRGSLNQSFRWIWKSAVSFSCWRKGRKLIICDVTGIHFFYIGDMGGIIMQWMTSFLDFLFKRKKKGLKNTPDSLRSPGPWFGLFRKAEKRVIIIWLFRLIHISF